MLLWAEGFDRCGTDKTQLLDGPWAEIGSPVTLVSSAPTPRTGASCMRLADNTGSIARKVFGAALTTVGVGFAVYFDALPLNNGRNSIEFRDAANAANLTIVIQSTGALAAYRGNTGGTLLGTSTDLLTAASWNHIEIRAHIDNSTGSVEVRLNGVTVLNLTGIDTCNTANVETSQVAWRQNGSNGAVWSIDDVFAWDTTGSVNNDFMGDLKCYLIMPNADTVEADWTPSSGGSGYAMIDEVPASASDYIQALAGSPDARSDFELQALPAEVLAVAAVVVFGKALKTDAGTCDVNFGVVSDGTRQGGSDRPLTTAAAYYDTVIETDPDTGLPWTPAAVNAAQVSYTRTA